MGLAGSGPIGMTRMSIILNTNKIDYMRMTCYQIVVYCNVDYGYDNQLWAEDYYMYIYGMTLFFKVT